MDLIWSICDGLGTSDPPFVAQAICSSLQNYAHGWHMFSNIAKHIIAHGWHREEVVVGACPRCDGARGNFAKGTASLQCALDASVKGHTVTHIAELNGRKLLVGNMRHRIQFKAEGSAGGA